MSESEAVVVQGINIEHLKSICIAEGRGLRYKNSERIEILSLNEIPNGIYVSVIVPDIYSTINHSRPCMLLWDAFESVINRMASKTYSDDSKRKSSMNTMMFNELCKRGIMLRLGRGGR